MYLQTFALNRFPFAPSIETDMLFEDRASEEAQLRLSHLVELRGIGLLTGEPGSGKTVVCRRLIASLPRGLHRVCYVALNSASPLDVANSIGLELGLPERNGRAAAWRQIRTEISRLVGEQRQLPVLILDEAHHLNNAVLEDLRILTNFAVDAEPRLCLLLVGLTELRRRLAMATNESLAQRLIVRHRVAGLADDEIGPYLAHCLKAAGAPDLQLFDTNAVHAIELSAHGLPRVVNQIAHYALTAAAAAKARQVTMDHVAQATDELRLKG